MFANGGVYLVVIVAFVGGVGFVLVARIDAACLVVDAAKSGC